MSYTKINLDVLTDNNTLDTVIAKLTKIREEHGGNGTVDIELDYEPYSNDPYIKATYIVYNRL